MSKTVPMQGEPEIPVETRAIVAGVSAKRSWLRIVHDICLAALIVYAVIQVCVNISHKPELVYPAEVQQKMDAEAKALGLSKVTVSSDTLDTLAKAYGFKNCEVGVKYGALCQDGEYELDRSSSVCSTHGGVKEYIECK